MAASPQPDDVVSRLAALERKVDELSRKTFNNLSVTDATTHNAVLQIGQDAAHSNRAQVQIRDSAGEVILANDTVAGWGYRIPNVMYPMMPYNSWAASQITSAGFQKTYWAGLIINTPRVNFSMFNESSGGTGSAGGQMRMVWSSTPGGSVTQMGSVQSVGGSGYQSNVTTDTYLWPSNMFGTLVYIYCQASMTSGVGGGNWVACTPSYIYGAGQ